MTSTETPVSAEERLKWLRRNLLIWLLAVLLLALIAIGVLFAAGVFTAGSANPTNVFSAGTLEISNNHEGSAILTTDHMVPGDMETGTVTIQNTGTVAGHFSLALTNVTDPTPGQGGGLLSNQLQLMITQGDQTVYNGSLSGMTTQVLDPNPWPPGEMRTFNFTITFPSTGTDGGDNAFQGAQAQADFTWHATSG